MAIADFAKKAIEEKKKQPKARVADFAKKAVEDKGQTKSVPVSDDKKQNAVKQNTFQVPASRKSNDSPSARVSGEIKPNTYTIPENRKASSTGEISAKYSKDKYGAGNIDLTDRPIYKNKDGKISTVRSANFEIDGKQVLLPTIAKDKNGKAVLLSDDEAVQRYFDTGEYLGKFDTVEESNAYAKQLHKDQDAYYGAKTVLEKINPEIKAGQLPAQNKGSETKQTAKSGNTGGYSDSAQAVFKRYGIDPDTFTWDDLRKWASINNLAEVRNGNLL